MADDEGAVVSLLLILAGLTALVAALAAVLRARRRERAVQDVLAAARREREREREQAERDLRAAEERSRVLAESSTDLVCVLDGAGIVRYASPASRDVLGLEPDALLGRPYPELVHADDVPLVRDAVREGLETAAPFTLTVRARHADGRHVWTEARVRLVPAPGSGALLEAHATVRDAEEAVFARAALEAAEERFRSAFEEAPIGMALVSPDFRFLRVNRALCELTGYRRDQLEDLPLASITHPDDVRADWEARSQMLEGEQNSVRTEKRFLHAGSHHVWVSVSSTLVRDPAGSPSLFILQLQDVTERRRREAELQHLADHDPLTGLLNRRAFERELERHAGWVERYGPKGAAVVLDIDHFKSINDTLGHAAGDELIVRVAHALGSRLRESDLLARLGGDEFAILLPEATPEEAETVAAAVLDAVRQISVPAARGRRRMVSASIGVARFAGTESAAEILVNADLAMYDAKEAGRDQVAAYVDEDGEAPAPQPRVSWHDLLREALAEDRFELHAQPIVDLATGRASQYELLLRLRTPEGELVGPAAFLPVAERFDLLADIDRWVVVHAIAALAAPAARDVTLQVNLATGDAELLALVARELEARGADPARLVIEIAEASAVTNVPRVQAFAQGLAALGCRFALDDFGAGFGSFYYLKHLPFDYLKIDGEFIRHCAASETDRLVIEAVVGIARGLGKQTIAEHVGDAHTVELLSRVGVDHAQGHHLGRPRPLAQWLAEPVAA